MSDLFSNDPQATSFWEQVAEAEKEGRGGGHVMQVEIGFGFKVFTKKDDGFTHPQTYFPYQVGNRESLNEAKKKANRFIVENALEKNPYNVFMVRLINGTVLNRDTNWQDDRYFFLFPTSQGYTEKVAPALRETGITALGTYWAQVTWAEDPGGKARPQQKMENGVPVVDENGDIVMEDRKPLIAYPVRIFASRDEAAAFCGVGAGADEVHEESTDTGMLPPMPEGYDAETWAATVAEIRSELGKGTKTTKVAADYGLPVTTIAAIKG